MAETMLIIAFTVVAIVIVIAIAAESMWTHYLHHKYCDCEKEGGDT